MRVQAIHGTSQTGAMVLHSGYALAAGAALAAAAAICAVIVLLSRKRITWETCLDIPVGLAAGQPGGTGTAMSCTIVFGEPRLRYAGPYTDGAGQGWLVVLAVTNTGLVPVRDKDFRTPLTFAFPGRQVHSTQIRPGPAARTRGGRRASRTPLMPAARADAGDRPGRGGSSRPARIQLRGRFRLNPNDNFTLTVILTGTPADASARIRHEASLTGGKIISGPLDADYGSTWLPFSMSAAVLLTALLLGQADSQTWTRQLQREAPTQR
jgi:hypothetical protein